MIQKPELGERVAFRNAGQNEGVTASWSSVEDASARVDDLAALRELLRPLVPCRELNSITEKLHTDIGNIGAVMAASVDVLAGYVGRSSANYLSYLYEAFRRSLRAELEAQPLIGSWSALEEYLLARLRHERVEQLIVLFLNRRNYLISDEVMQHGTVNHVPLYPREVARRALLLDASAVILVHNHPTGDPSPSREDVEMTRQVVAALGALEIAVHDHAIVGGHKVYSLRHAGLL